jgi:O-glycosyl hydrolase
MEDWYLTLYTLLSFAAHTKVSDLARHVVLDANGDAVEFQNEPDISNQEAVWAWAIEVQLAAMRSVSAIFSLECEVIESLSQRLRELAELDEG